MDGGIARPFGDPEEAGEPDRVAAFRARRSRGQQRGERRLDVLDRRLVQEPEFAVVADVDGALGTLRVGPAREERAVERPEHAGPLEFAAIAQGGEDRADDRVAF